MSKTINLKKYIFLYDVYNSQLTKVQREIFEMYYFDDLSFQEIANVRKISRAAIGDSIKKTNLQLEKLEKNLKLAIITKNILNIRDELNNKNPSLEKIKMIIK